MCDFRINLNYMKLELYNWCIPDAGPVIMNSSILKFKSSTDLDFQLLGNFACDLNMYEKQHGGYLEDNCPTSDTSS